MEAQKRHFMMLLWCLRWVLRLGGYQPRRCPVKRTGFKYRRPGQLGFPTRVELSPFLFRWVKPGTLQQYIEKARLSVFSVVKTKN